MREFIDIYPNKEEYTIDVMVGDFISIVEHYMNKFLTQWRARHLPFILGGNDQPATYIANWIIGQAQPAWISETYYSDIHKLIPTYAIASLF